MAAGADRFEIQKATSKNKKMEFRNITPKVRSLLSDESLKKYAELVEEGALDEVSTTSDE